MENNELLKIFDESKNVTDLLKKLNLSDNTINRNKIKNISIEINFDLDLYRIRKLKYCLNCGKILIGDRHKFCSNSCSATYNNTGRKVSNATRDKIRKTLAIVRPKKPKVKKEKLTKEVNLTNSCPICGIKITNDKICCSNKCSNIKKHKENYIYFLEHPSEYNNGGYTPKQYKDFFLLEQNNKCAICGMNDEWNEKKLIFVLDHIDGDASNNIRKNYRMICPNCDSQTSTFKNKNKNSTRRNYWKEKIIRDLQNKMEVV